MKDNYWWRLLVLVGLLVMLIVPWAAGAEKIRVLLGSHMDFILNEIPIFEERYGIEVEVDLVTTPDLRTKIVSSLITRRSPWDVIFVTANLNAELAERGWLVNLTDKVMELWGPGKVGLLKGSFEMCSYEGEEYAVPVNCGCPILIWNKQIMKDVGLDPEAPYEWHRMENGFDEFLAYAEAMTREVDGVQYYGYVDNWGGDQSFYFFNYQVQARGGDLFAEDGTPQVNSEEALAALQTMIDMYNESKCIDPGSITYTWCFDSGAPFWDGTRGMIYTWPFMVGVSMDPEKSKIPEGMVGAAPTPAVVTSASSDGSEFLAIPAYADNVGLGWKFIAFVASYEMQKLEATTTGWGPLYEDLLSDPDVVANQPWAPVILLAYQYPVNIYPSPHATERRRILADEVMKAILLKQSPEDALQAAQEALLKLAES